MVYRKPKLCSQRHELGAHRQKVCQKKNRRAPNSENFPRSRSALSGRNFPKDKQVPIATKVLESKWASTNEKFCIIGERSPPEIFAPYQRAPAGENFSDKVRPPVGRKLSNNSRPPANGKFSDDRRPPTGENFQRVSRYQLDSARQLFVQFFVFGRPLDF